MLSQAVLYALLYCWLHSGMDYMQVIIEFYDFILVFFKCKSIVHLMFFSSIMKCSIDK